MRASYTVTRRGLTRSVVVVLWLLANGTAVAPLGLAADMSSTSVQALWVWTPFGRPFDIRDEQARDTLVRDSALMAVRSLYVSMYRWPPNAKGRRMHQEEYIADLIEKADNAGIDVWATYGNFDWAEIGCSGFPMQRMDEVVAYNKDANDPAKFAGVVLDIEPDPLDFSKLLTLYECIQERLEMNGMHLAVAIHPQWDTLVEFGTGGVKQEAYKHIIDLKLSYVIVMGYR